MFKIKDVKQAICPNCGAEKPTQSMIGEGWLYCGDCGCTFLKENMLLEEEGLDD